MIIILMLMIKFNINMGGVRTKTIKRAARKLVETYFSRLTLDFDFNKRLIDEVTEVHSKHIRNQVAGYSTHLMRRIQRGPVKGITLKLQEEERARKLEYKPKKSMLDVEKIEIDRAAMSMLKQVKDFELMNKVVEFDRQRRQETK